MRAFEDPSLGVILLAPSSLMRSLLMSVIMQQRPSTATGEDPSATLGQPEVPEVVLEPLSPEVIDELTQLIQRMPPHPILVLCEADTFLALASREAGDVAELLGVQIARQELLDAVLRVMSSEPPIPGAEVTSRGPVREGLLSPREMEVLELLAEGATNKQIADRLSISLNTVYTHVRHIQGKLRTANRTQTAVEARAILRRS